MIRWLCVIALLGATSCFAPPCREERLYFALSGGYQESFDPTAEPDWRLNVDPSPDGGRAAGDRLVETFTREGRAYRVEYRVVARRRTPL